MGTEVIMIVTDEDGNEQSRRLVAVTANELVLLNRALDNIHAAPATPKRYAVCVDDEPQGLPVLTVVVALETDDREKAETAVTALELAVVTCGLKVAVYAIDSESDETIHADLGGMDTGR